MIGLGTERIAGHEKKTYIGKLRCSFDLIHF